MEQVLIYVLLDPETSDVRYVGWTADARRRLWHHVWSSGPVLRDRSKMELAYRMAAKRLHPDTGQADRDNWNRLQDAVGLLRNYHDRVSP